MYRRGYEAKRLKSLNGDRGACWQCGLAYLKRAQTRADRWVYLMSAEKRADGHWARGMVWGRIGGGEHAGW